ncbi:MAG TPA: hypothetical protein VGF86_04945 [Candidatus Tumulicola sp.]
MNAGTPSPEYEARLRAVLEREDWEGLRDFARDENQAPEDLQSQDRHFWEVLMHKIICNRLDMLARHERSREWLEANGYTADIGGF